MLAPRQEVLTMSEVNHGGLNRTELANLKIDPSLLLDFSASVNPFGSSPDVSEAIAKSTIHRYPDRETIEFRKSLSSQLGVGMECLIAGNGSSELLYLIGLTFLRPADRVLIVGPTYSEYARVAQLMGAMVSYSDAGPDTSFCFPLASVNNLLRSLQPRALFVCHPNNPTGKLLPTETIRQWADEFQRTLFIIDETYIEFSPNAVSFMNSIRDNVVVLRSMTKAYGLAGLRLGFAVSTPEVTALLRRVRPPWSVSTAAQDAGVAALRDTHFLRQSLAVLAAEKTFLIQNLNSMNVVTLPSNAHFFLIRDSNATTTRLRLLNSGVLVRDCTSFGMPEFLRISPQTPIENRRFIDAWSRLTVGR